MDQPFAGNHHSVSTNFDHTFDHNQSLFTHVPGHTHHDGSWVKPHIRAHNDGVDYNNLSYPDSSLNALTNHTSGLHHAMSFSDPLAHIDSYTMPPLKF